MWGGRSSSNRHKLKQERLRHPGSATGPPERLCCPVLRGFHDQSRQNLDWIPVWDQTRDLLRSLPASVILCNEYNFMLRISVSNRVKPWLNCSSCACTWVESADGVRGPQGGWSGQLRPVCAHTAHFCCCSLYCQILFEIISPWKDYQGDAGSSSTSSIWSQLRCLSGGNS